MQIPPSPYYTYYNHSPQSHLIILPMKQSIEIKTIQFVSPFPSEGRHNIIKENINSQNTTLENKQRAGSILRRTSYKEHHDPFRHDPQIDQLRIHNGGEKRHLCRSEIGKRSFSRAKEPMPQSNEERATKSNSISRYETKRHTQGDESDDLLRFSFQKAIKSNKLIPKGHEERTKTEPQPSMNLKDELMRRINKKIEFMKKMTSEGDEQAPATTPNAFPSKQSLFKFDKFYDHCLKSINKCINTYEKDPKKGKSKKYFQLKIEGGILTKELAEIRTALVQKKQMGAREEESSSLGIIGSVIDVKNLEKVQSHRANETQYKKKSKMIGKREGEFHNPFLMTNMCGWQVGLQKIDDFSL